MRYIAVLGSTGSIGQCVLKVARNYPEEFQIVALAAGENSALMIKQVCEFRPQMVAMATEAAAREVERETNLKVIWGDQALLQIATYDPATYTVIAVVGSAGLAPTLAALAAGKTVGLANKETLVTGGHLVMPALKRDQGTLLPIDSEHVGLMQLLAARKMRDVKQVMLTASGGALRSYGRADLEEVTVEKVLAHPNWSMGNKITVDCATMVNKGLEVIEAHWLYDIDYDKINVLLHPQSIVHALIEYIDGSILAQLSATDMTIPVQFALSYPRSLSAVVPTLDLHRAPSLDFAVIDEKRFPLLKVAYQVGKTGGSMPAIFNYANEVAVELFLTKQIKFLTIEKVIYECLAAHQLIKEPSLEELFKLKAWTGKFVKSLVMQSV
ncbi:MAG: hypothetical protein RLZ12_541 [Bacillota bacterium]